MLDTIVSMLNPPPHANSGEAYMLHQSLSAFHFLRAKAYMYEAHCQDPALKTWWHKARADAFETYIEQHITIMNQLGVPLPPSMPMMNELTDQFMAVDGAAMVKGMMEAHIRGLQSARRPDVGKLYRQMLDGALFAGAQLLPIVEREGWVALPPPYTSGQPHTPQ